MLDSSSYCLTLVLIIGHRNTKHLHLLSRTHRGPQTDFTLQLHTLQHVILFAGERVVHLSTHYEVSHPQPDVISIWGKIHHSLHSFLLIFAVVCFCHCSWDVTGYSSNIPCKTLLHTYTQQKLVFLKPTPAYPSVGGFCLCEHRKPQEATLNE